jgi:hypothetical protein
LKQSEEKSELKKRILQFKRINSRSNFFMKNSILYFIFVAGALLLSATDGFSKSSFGSDLNTACAPATPFTGDCLLCHAGSDRKVYTDAMDAYVAGGRTLTDYFCPTSTTPSCTDNDSDGYGNPGDSSCNNGAATDCNDNNAEINPGAEENCTDSIDNNCNNRIDAQDPNALNCPPACIDADGDSYAENCSPLDCDGTDANVHPGAFELCDDFIDNDCNGQFDCEDSACNGDPACLADSCIDYTDRRSCKADLRCNWSGKEKSCNDIPLEQQACQQSGGRYNKKKGNCR